MKLKMIAQYKRTMWTSWLSEEHRIAINSEIVESQPTKFPIFNLTTMVLPQNQDKRAKKCTSNRLWAQLNTLTRSWKWADIMPNLTGVC